MQLAITVIWVGCTIILARFKIVTVTLLDRHVTVVLLDRYVTVTLLDRYVTVTLLDRYVMVTLLDRNTVLADRQLLMFHRTLSLSLSAVRASLHLVCVC
jgi:hypothetical protein